MADRKLFFTVGADVAPATKGFDQIGRAAAKSMQQVEDSIDDTKSAGQRLAGAMNAEMDDIEASMKGTAEAAVALGRALGPELVAKVNLTEAATKFQRLGLTVDDIKADADALADVLRRSTEGLDTGGAVAELQQLESAAKSTQESLEQAGKVDVDPVANSAHRARESTDELSDSARGAHSAMANMVGNTAQDLGSLSGPIGSLGVGIGQMAEYAADATFAGEGLSSALKSMVAVAGPIAGLAVATQLLSSAMEANQKSAKLNAENINRMSDAIRKGGDLTENYADALSQAEDAQVQFGKAGIESTGILGTLAGLAPGLTSAFGDAGEAFGMFGKESEKLTDLLHGTGIGFKQWADTVTSSNPSAALGTLEGFLRSTNLSIGQQKDIYGAAQQAQSDWSKANENAARTAEFFGTAVEDNAAALERQQAKIVASSTAAQVSATQQQQLADGLARVNDKLAEQVNALNDQIGAAQSAADAQRSENDALATFSDRLSTADAKSEDVADAAIALAKAHLETASANAAAAGQSLNATQKLDVQKDALLQTAAAASGPARSSIMSYIFSLMQIPPEKQTDILTLLDRGLVDQARAAIDNASRTRQSTINVDEQGAAAASAAIDRAARDRVARIIVGTTAPAPYAEGGTVGAMGGVAGENYKPEILNDKLLVTGPTPVPAGTKVTGERETAALLKGAGSSSAGGTVINLHFALSVAAGLNKVAYGQEIGNGITAWLRTGGAGQLRRELGL